MRGLNVRRRNLDWFGLLVCSIEERQLCRQAPWASCRDCLKVTKITLPLPSHIKFLLYSYLMKNIAAHHYRCYIWTHCRHQQSLGLSWSLLGNARLLFGGDRFVAKLTANSKQILLLRRWFINSQLDCCERPQTLDKFRERVSIAVLPLRFYPELTHA